MQHTYWISMQRKWRDYYVSMLREGGDPNVRIVNLQIITGSKLIEKKADQSIKSSLKVLFKNTEMPEETAPRMQSVCLWGIGAVEDGERETG